MTGKRGNMKAYTYLLFDLDGTITESGPGITASVAYALEKLGVPAGDPALLNRFVGPPLAESFMKFYGLSQEEAKLGVSYYREYFLEKGIFNNRVYPGLLESLEKLSRAGKILAVATSKPEPHAKRIAEHFGFARYFKEIYGAGLDGTRLQKWEVIRYALKELGLSGQDLEKVLMIGDREHDILGAKKNGLASMGVLYGYGDLRELQEAGADYIARTTEEVSGILLGPC